MIAAGGVLSGWANDGLGGAVPISAAQGKDSFTAGGHASSCLIAAGGVISGRAKDGVGGAVPISALQGKDSFTAGGHASLIPG